MTDSDKKEYIINALPRIQGGEVQSDEGSHLAGVFGKAAQGFEELMHKKLEDVLKGCHVDFDEAIRPNINGEPPFSKLSLGKVAHSFLILNNMSDCCLKTQLDQRAEPRKFIHLLFEVNKSWVLLKHGEGTLGRDEAIEQLKNMHHAIKTAGA